MIKFHYIEIQTDEVVLEHVHMVKDSLTNPWLKMCIGHMLELWVKKW